METYSLIWEGPLSIANVASQLKKMLFGPVAEQASQDALRAEVIRVALWERSVLSRPYAINDAAISTQKILNRARVLLEPFSVSQSQTPSSSNFADRPISEDDNLGRQFLDELAEQGDLLPLAGGRWLPTPLRLVPITSELYLLAGSVPSSLLAALVLENLHLHSSFRQVKADIIQSCSTFDGLDGLWQFQALENWLGAPAVPLADLLQQFQKWDLQDVASQSSPLDSEAYVPSLNQPQVLRWRSLYQVDRDGRYLLRCRNLWGQHFYTIAEIGHHRLKRQSQVLESFDIRRLCYALDSEADAPTTATWDRKWGTLTLHSELPARERKRLATLGTLQKNRTGHYYPRIWHISPQHEQKIQDILSSLHVLIQ